MNCHACGLPVPDKRSDVRPATPFERLVLDHLPKAQQPIVAWQIGRVMGVSGSVAGSALRRLVMMGYLTDKYTRTKKEIQ